MAGFAGGSTKLRQGVEPGSTLAVRIRPAPPPLRVWQRRALALTGMADGHPCNHAGRPHLLVMWRLVLLILVVVGLAMFGLRHLPPAWDPRTPLDLTAEPNLLTGPKLRWMMARPEACLAAFDASRLPVTRVADRASDVGCGVRNAVQLVSSLRSMPAGPVVTCPMAAAWVLFERHTLQPEAQRHFGRDVTAFRQLGTHACRNVNHAATGRRSQHATANAMDVAGFVLRGGQEVRLAQGWSTAGREAAFLRAVRDGACRWFQVVLGPDYNAAHHDHFHLDMGPWRTCR